MGDETREGAVGFAISKTQGEFSEIWLQSLEFKLGHWALLIIHVICLSRKVPQGRSERICLKDCAKLTLDL